MVTEGDSIMKKINEIISGITSLFSITNSNVLEKYPSTYEKDVKKSLQASWNNVELAIRGAVGQYEKIQKTNK